jgi:fucose permease
MLILAAILAIFVYGMIAAMLGTILPDLSARFNLSPQQNGTIALMQAIGRSRPGTPASASTCCCWDSAAA